MLRSPGLKTAGKFYGFASADDLVVKLPSSRVDELIDSGRGSPCSPRPGRPMKEWVRITAPDEKSCLSYLLEARSFVSAVCQVQPKDPRFTKRFLVVTPGITIRDRLRTLSRYAWSESCVRLSRLSYSLSGPT